MTTAIIFYILSLLLFLIISSLIFRHTVKFSYLSPRFKYIVGFFAIIALVVILFSITLLFRIGKGSQTDFHDSGNINSDVSTGNLNF